jgi:steroid 5-alpha reductase family enzyme
MTELLIALFTLFLYMCFVFGIAMYRKDNGTADIAYGWGFVLVALFTFLIGNPGNAGFIATVLAAIWAARLSIRIYSRNHGKPEDFRYASMRLAWGKRFALNSFVQVFMLQGLIIFIVALPVSLLNIYGNGGDLSLLGWLGVLIWAKGFFFESVGDWQLSKFMRDPANKGRIMDKGLWHFTRHPNYYGESLMWWGLALVSSSTIWVAGNHFLAFVPFIGSALITFLLLKVSGVPLLEAHFAGKPEWEAYKAKTSVFIPWFPKK